MLHTSTIKIIALLYAGLLLQLLMKITLIVVLLESLCDIDFDGKNILKTIYIFLPYASLNVDDLWMMVTEIKNYIAPELVNWEQIYYNGNVTDFIILLCCV